MRQRKLGAAELIEAEKFDFFWECYRDGARANVAEMVRLAEHHRRAAAGYDKAADQLRFKLVEHQGRAIDTRAAAMRKLRNRPRRSITERLRALTLQLQRCQQFQRDAIYDLGEYLRCPEKIIELRESVGRWRASAEQARQQRRSDVADFDAKLAEVETLLRRIEELPKTLEQSRKQEQQIRALMDAIRGEADDWRAIDLPAGSPGTKAPPANTGDPTGEFVHFDDRNRPMLSAEFSPITGRVS